jgi:serine/threonine-protein kinase SIK3
MLNSQKKQKSIALGNYALKTTIGKGNSAVVKLATHVYTKQKVAIKMFDRSGLDNDKSIRLKREIDSMKRVRHSNIIQLYEV